MPDVGDTDTVTLLVSGFDGTTEATLRVTLPDGTTSNPVTSTSDGGNTWTAPVTYTLAGVWSFKWTVTGAGAQVDYQQAGVAPDPTYTDPNQRVYATTTDLANWLMEAPPVIARKSLVNASRALDTALMTAVYPTSDDGYPTDTAHRQAMRDACCAIVEWWMETGDELGAGGDWQSASAGGVSISRGTGTDGTVQSTQVRATQLPPRAWWALTAAGLLPGVIYQR